MAQPVFAFSRAAFAILAALTISQECLGQTAPIPQERAVASPTTAPSSTITVQPGSATTVILDRPFATLVIGDPDVIDVLTQNDRAFTIRSKRDSGATNIVIANNVGETLHTLNVFIIARAPGGLMVWHGSPKAAQSQTQFQDQFRLYRCADTCVNQVPVRSAQ